ncbi:hypothetical protein DBR42_01070 [Pelomonas sp. HMWF004]|nr:hypothetical protein DBR42_01070 [Pelomonas sp. HMWF004]
MTAKPKLSLTSFAKLGGTGGTKDQPLPAGQAAVGLSLIDVKKQVRSKLGDLTELKASIAANGVDTPILLLDQGNGRFLLIAGERRFQSCVELELSTIPARIFKDLTPQQIRAMQVRENNDRENLSAFDEAMGVIEDVEAYGVAEACVIWNRSESWISKRSGVQKWAPAVRELLSDGLCGDLEVLGSLQQLRNASTDEFARMENRIRHGDVPSRHEVRDKVVQVKEWKRKQAEKQEKAAESPTPAPAPASRKPKAEAEDAPDADDDSPAPAAPAPKPVLGPAAYGAAGGQAEEVAAPDDKEDQAAAQLFQARALAAEFAKIGAAGGKQLASLAEAVDQLDGDMSDSDWLLWSAFVQAVAPLLQPLGKRGGAFLHKLERELKAKTAPEDLWRQVQPVEEDGDLVSQVRPEGWHF